MKFIKIFSIIFVLTFSIYFSVSKYQRSFIGNINISIAKPILEVQILESNKIIANSKKQVLFKVSNFTKSNTISDVKLKYNMMIYISCLSDIKSIKLYKYYGSTLNYIPITKEELSIKLEEDQILKADTSNEDIYSLDLDLSDSSYSQNLDITVDVIASQIIWKVLK